jgi:DNA-binding transcriptional MocR family regulator
MFSDIVFNKENPIYLQIFSYLKELIKSGMMPKDSKLPSTRELASIMKVSRNSIIRAYELLEDDGLIYKINDKGTFVSNISITNQDNWTIEWKNLVNDFTLKSNSLDIVKSELPFKKGMISFKSIAPDENLFDIDEFKRAFLNRMSLEGEKLLNYGYAIGYKPLIDYLYTYMESKGVNVANKKILITNGFTEGFDILLSALTNKGDKIICENPTHNTAIKQMRLHNLNIIGVPMDSDGIDTNRLLEALDSDIKLAYLIPSYHNPTGIVMSYEKRIEVYNIFRNAGIPIVEDGFNEELLHLSSHIAPIAAFAGANSGIIYLGSLSKILFPGLRIGWILADASLIDMLESIKRSRNIHTSFLDQALLYEYLVSGGFERYLKKARKFYKEKFDTAISLAHKFIPNVYIRGNGGLHIFVKLKEIDSRLLLQECYKRGVTFLPGDVFYTDNSENDTLRLGFSRLSAQDMEKGFRIIREVINALNAKKS